MNKQFFKDLYYKTWLKELNDGQRTQYRDNQALCGSLSKLSSSFSSPL